ncbi:MAG: hypothetical protein V4594_15410 [Bacteroidota bacterium]
MTVISQSDFSVATGTAHLPGLAPMLMKLLDIHSFNAMMEKAGSLEGLEFTQYVLNFPGVTIEIDPADLANRQTCYAK